MVRFGCLILLALWAMVAGCGDDGRADPVPEDPSCSAILPLDGSGELPWKFWSGRSVDDALAFQGKHALDVYWSIEDDYEPWPPLPHAGADRLTAEVRVEADSLRLVYAPDDYGACSVSLEGTARLRVETESEVLTVKGSTPFTTTLEGTRLKVFLRDPPEGALGDYARALDDSIGLILRLPFEADGTLSGVEVYLGGDEYSDYAAGTVVLTELRGERRDGGRP